MLVKVSEDLFQHAERRGSYLLVDILNPSVYLHVHTLHIRSLRIKVLWVFFIVARFFQLHLYGSLLLFTFSRIITAMSLFHASFTALALLGSTSAYELKHNYDATNFFDADNFQFYGGWDKFTKGFANYVPIDEAYGLRMANITNGKVRLGVDADNALDTFTTGEGSGRKSIRVEGVDEINNGLIVADIAHLPAGGCGQWPAL